MFSGEVTYKSYDDYVNEVTTFTNYKTIGKDESGLYDLYRIDIGDPTNPSIFVTSGVHGNEWQTVYFTMDFMKQLDEGTFPDVALRNTLLDKFHIVYIPMVNPWGVDNVGDPYIRLGHPARRNSNNVDLNRDLINRTQVETNLVIAEYESVQPFAYLDCHMYQPYYGLSGGNNMIIGKGNTESYDSQHYVADNTADFSGESVTRWGMVNGYEEWFIGYAGAQSNPHAPYTLSLLSELKRPAYHDDAKKDRIVQKLTDTEIYENGNAINHLFFKAAIDFYNVHNPPPEGEIDEVVTPSGTHQLTRNVDGILTEVTSALSDGRTIKTTFNRDAEGYISTINRIEPPI